MYFKCQNKWHFKCQKSSILNANKWHLKCQKWRLTFMKWTPGRNQSCSVQTLSMFQVKEAMVGLWSRHLQSHSTWQKIQVEIEKWTDRSDKSLEILQSSLSEHNPTKNLIIHHFKLVRTKAFAEALLAKLRSQVRSILNTVGIQNTGCLNSGNVRELDWGDNP